VAEVDITFVKYIFELQIISDERAEVKIEKLGNRTRTPAGPVKLPCTGLRAAIVRIWVAVVPIVLFKGLCTIYPNVVGVVAEFGCIVGVFCFRILIYPPAMPGGYEFDFCSSGIFRKGYGEVFSGL